MKAAEVERMHLAPYRGGTFYVRRQAGRAIHWRVAWIRGTGKATVRFVEAHYQAARAFREVKEQADDHCVRKKICLCGHVDPQHAPLLPEPFERACEVAGCGCTHYALHRSGGALAVKEGA